MNVFLMVYLLGVVVDATVFFLCWISSTAERWGRYFARLTLAAPVWPLLVVIVVGTVVDELFHDAFGSVSK